MQILTLNTGSSSLKFKLMDSETEIPLAWGSAVWSTSPTKYKFGASGIDSTCQDVTWSNVYSAVESIAKDIRQKADLGVDAIAHRVVHGGAEFTEPVLITNEVEASLHTLIPLAPLHNGCSLEGITAARDAFPGLPQIAVFDTSFHNTLAPEAYTYPVPYDWSTKWNIRRFGFHGLSHEYCTMRAVAMLENAPSDGLRLIIAHLGHGASLAAVRGGRSVDTTMGFTPLEGPMMATRSGSIDPGLVIHAQRQHGLSATEVDYALNHESGLLGVSGISADMREVQRAAEMGNDRAGLAIEMYVFRLRKAIGAMAATLGGLDALVFTGGVGENSAAIRAQTCDRLSFLGLKIDAVANCSAQRDSIISSEESLAKILVVATDEELILCREAKELMLSFKLDDVKGQKKKNQPDSVMFDLRKYRQSTQFRSRRSTLTR